MLGSFLLSPFSKNRVGLDIRPDELRIVRIKHQRRGSILEAMGASPLPDGVVVSGKIEEPLYFQSILEALVEETGSTGSKAVVALPFTSVIQKPIEVPFGLSELEKYEWVESQLSTLFPGMAEELIFDFERVSSNPKSTLLRVTAARKDIQSILLRSVNQSGLKLNVIESEACALLRVVRHENNEPIMVLQIDSLETKLYSIGEIGIFNQVTVKTEVSAIHSAIHSQILLHSDKVFKSLHLFGASSDLSFYEQSLKLQFSLPVNFIDPFSTVTISKKVMQKGDYKKLSKMIIATSLAMRIRP